MTVQCRSTATLPSSRTRAIGVEGLEMGRFLGVAELAHRPVAFANEQLFGLEDALRRHQNVQLAKRPHGDMATGRSATKARHALTLTEEGAGALKHTLGGMSSLKGKVEVIAEQILRISEQTS